MTARDAAPGQAAPAGTFSAWMDAEMHWSTGYAYNAGDMESAYHGGWKGAIAAAAAAQPASGAPLASLRFALLGKIQELTGCENGNDCHRCNQHAADIMTELADVLPAPELAAAMAETRALRALIAEILSHFGPSGSGHTARVGQVQIRKWRKRLEDK